MILFANAVELYAVALAPLFPKKIMLDFVYSQQIAGSAKERKK